MIYVALRTVDTLVTKSLKWIPFLVRNMNIPENI